MPARSLRRRRPVRAAPPVRPVGAKLELTHACNLRCGFCYTDSPRHTLQRTADLDDDTWRRVVDEAVEAGVMEAVVTGGEPLLRAPLALELLERLTSAGVRTVLNTNGWFVDSDVADRLAGCEALRVHVSLDGPSPEVHDALRGVPGAWRRAVRAIDFLLARGVPVHVVHVVTPENLPVLDALLEELWLLGVASARLTGVVPVGAAARTGAWRVQGRAITRAVRRFRARRGEDMYIRIVPPREAIFLLPEDLPPAALLVRPSGAVLTDSLHPFAFADVRDRSLVECWQVLAAHWDEPEVREWSRAARRPDRQGRLTPYLHAERPVGEAAMPDGDGDGSLRARAEQRLALLRGRAPAVTIDEVALARSREHVVALALDRPHASGHVRISDAPPYRYVHLRGTGEVCRLNPAAAVVMDACATGSAREAVERLAARAGAPPRERIEDDVLGSVRWLRERGVLATRGPARVAAPA